MCRWNTSERPSRLQEKPSAPEEGMQLYINTFFLTNLDANLAPLNSDSDVLAIWKRIHVVRMQIRLVWHNSWTGDSHLDGEKIGAKMEVQSTTGYRHTLRGPSGAIGSSSARSRLIDFSVLSFFSLCRTKLVQLQCNVSPRAEQLNRP